MSRESRAVAHRGSILFLVGVSGMAAVACSKKESTDGKGSDSKGQAAANAAPAAPSAKSGAGCSLPGSTVSADFTLKAGCTASVSGKLAVDQGATFTLEPGATLEFESNASLWLNAGKIVARGSAEKPIRFKAKNGTATKGEWQGVRITAGAASGTTFEYVHFEHGGGEDILIRGALGFYDASDDGRVTVKDCTFKQIAGAAVVNQQARFAEFAGNSFENVEVAAELASRVMASVGSLKLNGAAIALSGDITESQTWPTLDGPILIASGIRIVSDKSAPLLTIAPKTTLQFAPQAYLWVGGGQAGGGLQAKEVTFTSASKTPAPGDWVGLVFEKNTKNSALELSRVEFAGAEDQTGKGAIRWYEARPADTEKSLRLEENAFAHLNGAAIQAGDQCPLVTKPERKNTAADGTLCE